MMDGSEGGIRTWGVEVHLLLVYTSELCRSPFLSLSLSLSLHAHNCTRARTCSPAHCEDKGEMQRRLRDMLPPPAAPTTAHVTAAAEQPSEIPIEISGDEPELQTTQDSQDKTLEYVAPSEHATGVKEREPESQRASERQRERRYI